MMRSVLGLALTPLLAYPVLAGCLLLVDAWRGEAWLPHYLRYEQRELWDTFWGDYVMATPIMYVAVAASLLLFLGVRRLASNRPGPLALMPLLAALGWGGGAFVTGSWIGAGPLATSVAGALVGVPSAIFTSGLLRRTSENR